MTQHNYPWTTARPLGARFFPPLLEERGSSMNVVSCCSAETHLWLKVLLLIWPKSQELPFLEKWKFLVIIALPLKKKKLKKMKSPNSRWTFEPFFF